MMAPQYIVQTIFILAGLIALLASAFNWNWFFNAQNTRFIVQHVGRVCARLLYGVLGLVLIGIAAKLWIDS